MRELEYNFTYREKDKGFQVILSYKDSKGRWKQKSKQGFKTKKLAKIAGDKLLDQVKEKASTEVDESLSGITLKQLETLFLQENAYVLEYNTQASYHSALRAFKNIAAMPINEIKYTHIINCLNTMAFAESTKSTYLAKIKRLLNYAVSPCKIIRFNPASEVPTPKDKRKKKIRTVSMEEFKSILAFAHDSNHTIYVKLAIAGYAGLRYGEIAALKWDAINLVDLELTVNSQLAAVGKNKYAIKTTKSVNSYRTIPIPPELAAILSEYRRIVPTRIDLRLFDDKTTSTFLVNRAIRDSGYALSIHDLRHTYATRLLANGVDIKTVAALLGDTVQTVINTYIHYSDEMRAKAKTDIIKIFA